MIRMKMQMRVQRKWRVTRLPLILLAMIATGGALFGDSLMGLAQPGATPPSPPPTPEDPADVFFNRCLFEFEGLVAQGKILCGSLQERELSFRPEDGGGVRLYAVGEIAALLRSGEGLFEVFLRNGDRIRGFLEAEHVSFRLPLVEGVTLSVSTDEIELLLLQGGLFKLSLEHRLAIFERITQLFRLLRLRADTVVLENGAVIVGRLQTQAFQIRVNGEPEPRTYFKGDIDRIIREPDGKVTLLLRGRGRSNGGSTPDRVQGELVTTRLEMSLLGSEGIPILLEELRQVVMQNSGLSYCSNPRCVELVEFTKE